MRFSVGGFWLCIYELGGGCWFGCYDGDVFEFDEPRINVGEKCYMGVDEHA